MRRGRREDQGNVAVETAVLVPPLVALMALVIIIGRVGNSKLDIDAAAQSAARTISIARSPEAAVADAEAAARSTLRVGSATCRDWTFRATTTPTQVTVEMTCVVDLSAASMIPMPGNRTLASSATEVLDQYREHG
jgi:Flp pilus assembly protein TadG